MVQGEAAINSRRSGAGRNASTGAGAQVQRGAPGIEVQARARSGRLLARSRPRGMQASTERCHAGGALRPLLMMRLRGQARRERQPLDPAKVWARLAGGAAVATVLLVVLLSLGERSRLDAPAAAGTAFEQARVLEAAAVAAEVAPTVATVELAPEATVVALRLVEPQPIPVTLGELYQALARSNWPRELWPQVARIAQCEARWGGGVDAAAEGDSGRALGVLQIRVDAHRELARDFNLLTIDGALGAAWVVFQRAGYSFAPWSCA